MSPERLRTFRKEMTAAMAFNLLALAFYHWPGLPFHPRFVYAIWASIALHIVVLARFDAACKDGGRLLSMFTMANIAIMVPVLHYSGGAASPFAFVLITILVSRAAYGIRVRYEIAAAAAAYFGVVAAEVLGLAEPWPIAARDVYSSVPALILIGINMLAALVSAGHIYRQIFEWLTESLSAEQEAKSTALRELARLEPAAQQSMVVSKLAHDINGRLTALSGTIQELERERAALPRGAAESLEDLKRSLGAVTDLTERIRNYSERKEESPVRVDLWASLRGVLRTVRHLPGVDGVDLILRDEPPAPVTVLAFPRELERAYLNLVKNAVEAAAGGPAPRRVEVGVLAVDGHAVVSVKDYGPGMPPELLDRVMRGRVTTKPGGSGLGLLIAREICALHRGRLSVASAPGRGTEVTTTIPINAKEEPSA